DGYRVPRPAAIDVADPVVSTVRLFPESGGTTVSIFVRQPVTYSVSRPSGIGEITIELRSRTRALGIAGVSPRGRARAVRPKTKGRPSEVSVDAESLAYERETNTLVAHGGVTLTRGDTTLTADEVRYDRTNAIAEARGHVVITDPEANIDGDFAHLNLDDESGWVEAGTAELKPSNYTLTGERIEKRGGPLYAASHGVFPPCRGGGARRRDRGISLPALARGPRHLHGRILQRADPGTAERDGGAQRGTARHPREPLRALRPAPPAVLRRQPALPAPVRHQRRHVPQGNQHVRVLDPGRR